MSISLKELSARAGLSPTAVSLVMNNKHAGHVPEARAKEIRDLARKLGYRPNLNARSLRGCARKLIGVLMPLPRDASATYFSILLQQKIGQLGYMPLFSYWHGYSEVAACYRAALDHNVDGIIAWENPNLQLAKNTPQVIYFSSEQQEYDAVNPDNLSMLKKTVKIFQQKERKRICLISTAESFYAKSEISKLANKKSTAIKLLSFYPFRQNFSELVESNFAGEEHPDAVFVHNDALAETLAQTLRDLGKRVPEDVMIIGCNNMLELPPTKPLPTFDIHHEEIVDKLIKLLFRRIAKPDATIKKELVKPSYLEKINSTVYGPLPKKDFNHETQGKFKD